MRWDQLAEVETNNLLLTSVAGREGSASASRLGTRMVSALGVYRLGYTSVYSIPLGWCRLLLLGWLGTSMSSVRLAEAERYELRGDFSPGGRGSAGTSPSFHRLSSSLPFSLSLSLSLQLSATGGLYSYSHSSHLFLISFL